MNQFKLALQKYADFSFVYVTELALSARGILKAGHYFLS